MLLNYSLLSVKRKNSTVWHVRPALGEFSLSSYTGSGLSFWWKCAVLLKFKPKIKMILFMSHQKIAAVGILLFFPPQPFIVVELLLVYKLQEMQKTRRSAVTITFFIFALVSWQDVLVNETAETWRYESKGGSGFTASRLCCKRV